MCERDWPIRNVNEFAHRFAEPPAQQPYVKLLSVYPSVLRHAGLDPAVTAKVAHLVEVTAPPTFSQQPRIALDNLQLAPTEFDIN